MPADDEIRVGLVGLGAVCEGVHYPGFSRIPGVQIGAICDANLGICQRDSRGASVRTFRFGTGCGPSGSPILS